MAKDPRDIELSAPVVQVVAAVMLFCVIALPILVITGNVAKSLLASALATAALIIGSYIYHDS